MKTTILLLVSATLVGCSTTHVKQTNEFTVTYHRPDGTIERTETRKLDSDVSANGDGNANVAKLKASQTKSGTLSLGTEGAEGEVTSPAVTELVKSLNMLIELGKALAK